MKVSAAASFIGLFALAAAVPDGYSSIQRKFGVIESGRAPAGARITLTEAELNSWVRREVPLAVPSGVRDPRVELGSGSATGYALVDFAQIRRAQGKPPGWLAERLLSGERPIRVTARITSSRGQAQVDVERVEVAGMAIEGQLLDYLIRNYLLPRYPTAAIGRPFELGYGIDRLEVNPDAVNVVMSR